MVKLMVHMFLVASMAQEEICTSKSCAAEQLSLIQAARMRSGPLHSKGRLGCSSKQDDNAKAIQMGKAMGHTLPYGCLDLQSLCDGLPDFVPADFGGASTLALIHQTCPETCGVTCCKVESPGVPCADECDPVHQCDWGMLTTVTQTAEGCDVVTCTPLKGQEPRKCPWLVGTSGTENFECHDGSICGVTDNDCCNDKGGRVKCPNSHPYMCNEPCPKCDLAGVSFSCQMTTCNANGGYRTCNFTQALLPREKGKLQRARNEAKRKAAIRAKLARDGEGGEGGEDGDVLAEADFFRPPADAM